MIEITVHQRARGSTRDFVYRTLKKKIIELELKPGQKISEQDIADVLNVSRTPVREAFLKLSQEELLGIYPQKGTIVSEIDLDYVEEGRFVREKIESAIVRLACENLDESHLFQIETNLAMQTLCLEKGSYHRLLELDDKFHELFFDGCSKQRTWEMIRKMNGHFDRLRMLRLASNRDWEIVVMQHKEIYECITNKDADKAETLTIKHLNLVNFEKTELKLRYPDYFK